MPSQKSYRLIMLFLTVALVATAVVALCIGRYSVNPTEAFGAVGSYLQKLISGSGEKPTAMENVVFVLRIPRILGQAFAEGRGIPCAGGVGVPSYDSRGQHHVGNGDVQAVHQGGKNAASGRSS